MRIIAIFFIYMIIPGCSSPPTRTAADESQVLEPREAATVDAGMIGDYLCTVAEKASIESSHLEGSGPPAASIDTRGPTRFKVRISQVDEREMRLTELPYDGKDRDPVEWHTPNSVIHQTYSGDGKSFSSTEKGAEAFFVIGPTAHANPDGNLKFYHSGFEWAGGEDNSLSIRWGRCNRL